jgi:polysaccharide export outer membrane protein
MVKLYKTNRNQINSGMPIRKCRFSGFRVSLSTILLLFLVMPFSFSRSPAGFSSPQGALRHALSPACSYAETNYVLGPEDEISIIVWDHPDLARKTRINLEGRISFPLIGELQVAGLTQLQLEKKLTEMLADGYIVNPQVSVQVTDYRSQKIFVIGEVNSPGAYPLTKRTMVVEAIAMAGGVKPEADQEIMIVRPKRNHAAQGAVLPDEADPSELIKVRLRDVLEGERNQNIEVLNLDTIFIPKIKVFYVTGEVKRPGQYTFMKGMTVLNAVSTAGGFTEKAAKKKVKTVRENDGKKEELSLTQDAAIEPGDTIVVPESFW